MIEITPTLFSQLRRIFLVSRSVCAVQGSGFQGLRDPTNICWRSLVAAVFDLHLIICGRLPRAPLSNRSCAMLDGSSRRHWTTARVLKTCGSCCLSNRTQSRTAQLPGPNTVHRTNTMREQHVFVLQTGSDQSTHNRHLCSLPVAAMVTSEVFSNIELDRLLVYGFCRHPKRVIAVCF